jgi:hypothetical protein
VLIISLMARKVVNCLRAIVETANLPFAASRRNPLAVIPPFGNAIAAAADRRSVLVDVRDHLRTISSHGTSNQTVIALTR